MKGIKRYRSWERSYALDTPYPYVTMVDHTPMTPPHDPPHPPTLRAPPYTHARCNQRTPVMYPYNVSLHRYNQHISATYLRNVSLQYIPTTYSQYISLQHIPTTYPQYISPILTTPHPPMDICGNLW